MLRRVDIIRTDVSEEHIASISRVKIGEQGTTLAVSSSRSMLFIRRNIPEDDILHSYRRENVKSYIALTGWTL
jgi:hypothetical protein